MTSEYFMRGTLTQCLTYCIFLCIFTTYSTSYCHFDKIVDIWNSKRNISMCMYVNTQRNMRTEKCACRQTGKQMCRQMIGWRNGRTEGLKQRREKKYINENFSRSKRRAPNYSHTMWKEQGGGVQHLWQLHVPKSSEIF